MKPMHHTLVRLSRCPCCHSPYTRGGKKKNDGKSAARNHDKQLIKKELKEN